METEKVEVLALRLLEARIAAYWNSTTGLPDQTAGQWRNRPGDQALQDWKTEAIQMAKVILGAQ